MTAGSELQRDPSWKCPDFCVVATSLLTRERPSSQKSRKHAPDQAIAGTTFPNVHHGLRPTPAILLQHPFQPLRNLNDSDVVAINRPAPFSGDLASTKLQHDLQHTGSCRSKSCGGAASKSHNNRAACESPIVDLEGEALCSKSLERCGKPLERSPDALRARREGGVEGQLPSTLQCSAPKLYNDTSAITSPAMVRADDALHRPCRNPGSLPQKAYFCIHGVSRFQLVLPWRRWVSTPATYSLFRFRVLKQL